ncbi:hypothetical protein FB567DRAFT_576673 [Paraphoma chrysanthemicola]|uniref:MIT domain-containing protein n=1 Tax=Paraphoma chrysanthemicola TaxID=798071 RepID=A0A8K0RD92_9PLEO|nr:hypothetical protein FB567DRAFT_576673 [Paraphoma chrysanthemicola]
MSTMEEELLMITSKSSSLQRGLGVTWNSSVLMEHQHRIRGQVAALQLLLQVMNLPRKEDRIEVLSVKEKVLVDSDESALSIIPSDRSTRFSLDGNRLSMVSEDGDIKYIRFSFEDALFTSHVYKRNYRFPTKQTQGRNDHRLATHVKDSIGSLPANSNTRSVINNLIDEDDEVFFQDSMIQLHQDLLSEASSDTNTDQSVSHQHEKSRDSNPILSVGLTTQQKLLLSRALQKANTAVMLDRAQNFESAIQSYEAACKLLQHVAARMKHLPGDQGS